LSKKVVSMIISLLLVGCTLGSLGIFYSSYQSDLRKLEVKLEDDGKVYDQKEAEWKKENGEDSIYWDFNFPEDEFYAGQDELASQFKTLVIIHGVIIAFIIFAELGLLLVLPKRTNYQNINLDIRNNKEQ
jgi:hypothetical protein